MTGPAFYEARARATARRYRKRLDRRYAARRYRTRAVVTLISTDSAGRATGATATIDGAVGQSVLIDHGAPIAVGDSFVVENIGTATAAQWSTVRKARSTVAVPGVGETPTLPTPSGLTLQTGLSDPLDGGPILAWVYASWQTIGDEWGIMSYEASVRLNDPGEEPFVVTVFDEMPTTQLDGAISDSVTMIVRDPEASPAEEYNFAKFGRIKIESELIDYTAVTDGQGTSGTGTGGINIFTDSGASWDTNEWANYVLIDSASAQFLITSNTDTVLTVVGTPASGSYNIKPAFTDCTRGAGSTSAASHADNKTVARRSAGTLISSLPADTDYNVRVRARRVSDGAISGWTDWVSIQTDVDTQAPPAPTDLDAADAVGGIDITWSGPTIDSVPDLAGFEIYTADDDTGTNPVLRQTLSATYHTYLPWYAGQVAYINAKAYDYTGNKSDWAEATWLTAHAIAGQGMQLLTNADFERDKDGDDIPDDYTLKTGDGTPLWSWTTNGISGGHAITVVLDDDEGGEIWFDERDNDRAILGIGDHHYCASVHIHTTVDDEYINYYYSQPDGFLSIRSCPFYTESSGMHSPAVDSTKHYRTQDNWIRVSGRDKPSVSTISSFPHVGHFVLIRNRTGAQITVHIDRPQLEQDVLEPSEWKPGIVPPGGSSVHGLLIDCAGIKTFDGTFYLDDDGKLRCNLLPEATGTRDLGSSSLHFNTVYADNLAGGAEHDPVSLAVDAQQLLTLTTQEIGLVTAGQGQVLAGPSGASGDPDFRVLVFSDLPAIDHANLNNVTSDQHHAQSHVLSGGDHTASGLTVGYVIRATAATTFAWGQLQHADLGGVTPDLHHNQQHDVVGSDHTITASQYDLVGATAVDTIGLLTPSAAPSGVAILRSDSNAGLQLTRLGIGAAPGADDQITMANGATIGQAAGPLLTFDDSTNILELTGGDLLAHADGSVSISSRRYSSDINPPTFYGDKARGTETVPANIVENDGLLALYGRGYYGGSWYNAGYIAFKLDGTPSTNMPGRFQVYTKPDSATGPQPWLTIKSDGKTGIGTIIPDKLVEVLDASNPQLRLTHTQSSKYADFQATTDGYLLIAPSSDRVGIADVTTPAAILDVQKAAGTSQLRVGYDATYAMTVYVNNTGEATVAANSSIVLDPGSQHVNPGSSVADDLGDYTAMWRTIFASELYVETLVAQDVLATIGGRIMVVPTTRMTSDLSGTNHLSNSSFEDWTAGDLDNWLDNTGDGSIDEETTVVYSGSSALKLTAGTLRNTLVAQNYGVSGSTTYCITVWHKCNDTTKPGRYWIHDITNGAELASGNLEVDSVGNTYTLTSIAFDTVATTAVIQVRLRCPNTATEFAYCDLAGLWDATIETEHNLLDVNDYIMMKAAPGGIAQTEVYQVTKDWITDPYTYGVRRGIDKTLPNAWYNGAAVVTLGYAVGEGYIEITSTETIHQQLGPAMTIFVRDGTANWDDVAPVIHIGELKSYFGLSSSTFGLAMGNDLEYAGAPTAEGFLGAVLDATNGLQLYNTNLRLYDSGTVKVALIVKPADTPVYGKGIFVSDGVWGTDTTVFAAAYTDDATVGSLNAGDVIVGKPFHATVASRVGIHFDKGAGDLKLINTDLLIYDAGTLVFEINNEAPSLALGNPVPTAYATGTGIWMGLHSGYYKFRVGIPAGLRLAYDGVDFLIGDDATDKPNMLWDNSEASLFIRSGTVKLFEVNADATSLLRFGSDVSASATTALVVFGDGQTYGGGSESVGAGDLMIGDNDTDKANVFWDKSLGYLNFRTGTTDVLVLDDTGIRFDIPAAESAYYALKWGTNSNVQIQLTGWASASQVGSRWQVLQKTNCTAHMQAIATSPAGYAADYLIFVGDGSNEAALSVHAGTTPTFCHLQSDYVRFQTGYLLLNETTSTPGAPGADDELYIYVKANNLILKWNDGGTKRYKWLELDGTGVAWQHSTTEPT